MATRTFGSTIDRLQQPEYTGENRCRTCTVLNSFIAIAVAAVVAVVSPPAALAVLAVSAATIFFRGYLIPGTPTIVTYFPEWVHDAIGAEHDVHAIEDGSGIELEADEAGGQQEPIDTEAVLVSADIVRECADGDDLCLTETFRSRWEARIASFGDGDHQTLREGVGSSLSVDPEEISFEESDDGWFVLVDGIQAGGWPSRASLVADLATVELLESELSEWESMPVRDRTVLIAALRTFVESCPDCGGDVVADEEVLRSCCRGEIVSVSTACEDCGATIFEGTER